MRLRRFCVHEDLLQMMCGVYKMRTKAEIMEDDAENYLYEFINAHSDFSVLDLSKRLGWTTEKVSHAIKKLDEDGSIEQDGLVDSGRSQTTIHPVGWDRLLPDDAKDDVLGKFLWWLLQKGYAQRTATSYDEEMRRAEKEHLTIESVNDIYCNCSQGKRTRLRHAVRLLEEYYHE